MKQTRANFRGAIVLPTGRNPNNTNRPFLTMQERSAQIQKYWGDLNMPEPPASNVTMIKATKVAISPLVVDGKILIAVQNLGAANVSATFKKYNQNLIDIADTQNEFYYFVLEEQLIFRRLSSDFDADGIAYAKFRGKKTTHLGIRFGKSVDNVGDTWFHVIVNSVNEKNGVFVFIEDHDGLGGEPPGSGAQIPVT